MGRYAAKQALRCLKLFESLRQRSGFLQSLQQTHQLAGSNLAQAQAGSDALDISAAFDMGAQR